jgi:glycosyltransferase involved in cell wall biosynthesis
MIKALPVIHRQITLKIVGTPDEPGVMDYYRNEIAKHHLQDRVQFLGRVDDAELIELYANALAVYYAPHNEDYGYVTLETMASGKPVVTATDSGGVLEFVSDNENGLVVEPTTDAIGRAINRLVEDTNLARSLGQTGATQVKEFGVTAGGWAKVVAGLLSPLKEK